MTTVCFQYEDIQREVEKLEGEKVLQEKEIAELQSGRPN